MPVPSCIWRLCGRRRPRRSGPRLRRASCRSKTASGPAEGTPNYILLLATVSLGSILAPINSTMLAVALPELRHDFGVGHAEVAWLVSAYLIAMAVARGMGPAVITNGWLLPAQLENLAAAGLATVYISIDAPAMAAHEKHVDMYRRSDGGCFICPDAGNDYTGGWRPLRWCHRASRNCTS